ncbi:MAG: GNAT family N-acetyltransferase [Planctomycetes bacterium]|nr:GNAT family N-acetyltransferase [Planctomycetota bacterium]
MSDGLTVKRLVAGDEELATRLLEKMKGSAAAPEAMGAYLAAAENLLVGAFDGKEQHPVGWVLAYLLPHPSGRPAMTYLHEIDVLKERRREGIGSRMLDLVREQAAGGLFLFTNESSPAAVAFYKANGSRRPHMDDLLLLWQPPSYRRRRKS